MTDNKTKETEVEKSIRLDERKNNFKKEVKKRLYTEFKRTRWNYDDLVDELRERDYKVNKGTLKNMVDPINESSFDLWIIKGLCECFNISLGELLEDHMLLASKEKTAEPTSEDLKNIDTNNKLLQDFRQYKGTYYCYSNSKNYGKNDIVEFMGGLLQKEAQKRADDGGTAHAKRGKQYRLHVSPPYGRSFLSL